MSAPEDTTATAKPATDHHQNVVPPTSLSAATASSSAPAPPGATAGAAATVAAAPAAIAGSIVPTTVVSALSGAVTPVASGTDGATSKSNTANESNSSEETVTASIKNAVPRTAAVGNGSSSGSSVTSAAASGVPPVPSGTTQPVGESDKTTTPLAVVSCSAALGSATPPGAHDALDETATSTPSLSPSNDVESTGGTADEPAAAKFTPVSAAAAVVSDEATTLITAAAVSAALIACSSSSTSSLDSVAGHTLPEVSNGADGDIGAPPSDLSGCGLEMIEQQHSPDYHCRMLESKDGVDWAGLIALEELQSVKESEAKLKQQYSESQHRERMLARRLAVKEQEIQDYANQLAELKSAQAPGPAALRSALLDPAVNILFQKLKGELQATKAKLEETQNELSAWKFTPDSNTGKRLMAKCRLLYQENEELGKMTSNGRLAKLESELALQKSYNEEVKKSQLELDDFLQELDEDVEGMQGTIVFLQQELKQTKDTRDELEKELAQLRAYVNATSPLANPAAGNTPTDEHAMLMMMDMHDTHSNSSSGSAYHRLDSGGGAGPDTIGGGSIGGVGIGGGITPIYLVNGGGTGSVASRLVNKSSSSGDHDVVYSNRTHCGGVVNSNELRTTPASGSGGGSTSGGVGLSIVAPSSLTAVLPAAGESLVAAVNGDGATGPAAAEGVAAAGGGATLVNELNDPLLLLRGGGSDGNGSTIIGSHHLGGRTSSGNDSNNSNHAGSGSSVNSGSSSSAGSSANSVLIKQQQQQLQHIQHHQQPQRLSNNNGGRNGGRTTVAARKRNYNDTEGDSAAELLAVATSSGGGGVGGVVGGESGGVHLVDGVGVTDSGAVPNGKLVLGGAGGTPLDGGGPLAEPQDIVEANSAGSNKRMTRSGKGKAASAAASTPSSVSSPSTNASANVLMTSAAKKLRRGSVTMEEENDPLADTQPQPQHLHHTQQTISSANGSN